MLCYYLIEKNPFIINYQEINSLIIFETGSIGW